MRRNLLTIVTMASLAALSSWGEAIAQPVAIDLSAPAAASEVGYRYGRLSRPERRALRRGFKLPMDAIFSAETTNDLVDAVVIAQLPDPNKPLLATAPATGDRRNPFGGPNESPQVGSVLDRLFQADAEASAGESSVASQPADSDPFAEGDFGADSALGTDDAEPTDDPFAAPAPTPEADPAPADAGFGEGLEEDPFADF